MSFLHMVTKIHAQHALLSDSGDIQPHRDCPYWSLPALVYFQKEERRKSRNHHQMFVCRWIYAMTSIAPAATRAFTRMTPLLRRWKNSFRSTIQRALPSQRFFCLSKEVQFLMQATSGLIFLFCRHRISFLFQKIQKPALYLNMVYIHQT